MARIFGAPYETTWALGTTVKEVFTIPPEYGDLTGAVPRSHIRKTKGANTLLLALGVAAAGETGFVLDSEARTLTLTITPEDTYTLTANENIVANVACDIEFRFGTGASLVVWPFIEILANLVDRWTYFANTDAP